MFRSAARPLSFASRHMMSTVSTPNAPAALGPYSQAVKFNDTVYLSGCLGLDAKSMQMAEGVEGQSTVAMKNLKSVLEASGSSLGQVIKCTVFLKDMNDFTKMNAVYEKAFDGHKPARSCVEVARLPKDALMEVEAIAALAEADKTRQ